MRRAGNSIAVAEVNLVQHDERRTLAHLRGHGADHAILVGVNGNWCTSLIHANDTNRLSSQ